MEGYNMYYILGVFGLYAVFTAVGAGPFFSAFDAVEELAPLPRKEPVKSWLLVFGTLLLSGWFFGFFRMAGFPRLREGFIAGFTAAAVRDGRLTREGALAFVQSRGVTAEELDRHL